MSLDLLFGLVNVILALIALGFHVDTVRRLRGWKI